MLFGSVEAMKGEKKQMLWTAEDPGDLIIACDVESCNTEWALGEEQVKSNSSSYGIVLMLNL